ncbi:beta-ketoacyl synthase [Streptococcus troglodytae]|uniref:Beta-ketoacyl synthase n=2 Tax=Streptococcus troglodytae TaxID=1111760 RepID=A0A1L7LJE0_9STRE|nr:beta-ketoacyl synthase [Streptococcus troglodytae]
MDNRLCETIERIIAQYDLLANESRFTENKIYGKELYAISDEGLSNHSSAIKSNGTYVITGGLGGLGYIFSTYIAKKYQSRLILLGRSELSKESEMKITELRGYGSQVTYYACDVCDFNKVDQVVRNIGEITGIIHCAGIINQTSIMSDNMTEIEAVIAPKLYGTMNLDIATKDHDLDFIVLFSSISAIVGDYGCVSYASANKFMDEFSNLREELRKRHKRNGKQSVLTGHYGIMVVCSYQMAIFL